MGLLDGLLGSVLRGGGPQGQSPLVQVALQLIQQNGGVPGIISKFEHGGMADHVGSWVGIGENLPITGGQLQEILGTLCKSTTCRFLLRELQNKPNLVYRIYQG
jgi:uncharacterized protein YidB (DUF937 family)